MADETDGLAEVLGKRLDVRDEVVRLGERIKQAATREEMNDADFRTERNVGVIIDRSAQSLQQYVRDRVNESSLKTENALQVLEKHLKEHQSTTTAAAVTAALAPVLTQLQVLTTPPEASLPKRGWHPAGTAGVGAISGASILYLVLAFLNMVPRP